MKIIILKEKLLKGLNFLSHIPNKNINLPILGNILIESYKNFLTIIATDLEIAVKYWSLAKIEKNGSVSIPSNMLLNTIKFLSEKSITLEAQEQNLIIKTKEFTTSISGLLVGDFPVVPEVKKNVFFTIPCFVFCHALSQVYENTSSSSSRPEISGVCVFLTNNQIKIVATDSFRLAEKTIFLKKPINIKENCSFILPQKTVKEIINIFGEKKEEREIEKDLNVYFDSNQILVESLMQEVPHPEIHLVSRLIEGEYPNYVEIIPKKHDTQIILDRENFLNQIKLASLFCGKTNEVKLKIDSKESTINILSQSPDLGQHNSFLEGKIKGISEEISFNCKFLLDGILKIKEPEIIFELTRKNADFGPGVLRPTKDQSYIYVLMPLKTI